MVEQSRETNHEPREVVKGTILDILRQNNQLTISVLNSLSNGGIENPSEITAALHLVSGLSSVSEAIIQQYADLFSSPAHSLVQSDDELNESQTPPRAISSTTIKSADTLHERDLYDPLINYELIFEPPKTYAELLTAEIEKLVPQQERFKKGEIKRLISGVRAGGIDLMIQDEGLNINTRIFTREQTINIIRRRLRRPHGIFNPKDHFSRTEIYTSFFQGKSSKLDDFSEQIGYDWRKNPVVPLDTALDLRALAAISRLKVR